MITASERILTNQLLIDELDLWFELDNKSIEDDEAKKFYQKLSSLIDDDLDAAIKWLESDEAKEIFFGQVEAQKEIFDALETEWDSILNQSYDSVDELLDEIYKTGKEKGYENIRETLRYTDADRQAIRIAKDYNFHLIRKLDNDLRGTVKNKILKGIISGENPYNLARDLVDAGVQQLDGSTFTPRQRATMIAKTETSRMQNTGMLQSYINEGYREVKILTAEDSNVCTTCLEYAYRFNKDEPRVFSPELLEREKVHNIIDLIKGGLFPPFHPLCRCTYLTVWKTKEEPPKDPYIIDLTYVGNWVYEHDNIQYQFQGNTPQGRNKFKNKYGIDVDQLNENPKDKSFLVAYTDDGDNAINGYLRGLLSPEEAKQIWNDVIDDLIEREEITEKLYFDEALEIYKDIFKKYSKTLEEDIIVCRRERNRYMGNDGATEYNDGGFTSTSIYEYVEKYGDEINYILIPAGTKVIYIEEITMVKDDYEILIAPGIHLDLIENLSPRKKVWK